jgi:hypothetical protein
VETEDSLNLLRNDDWYGDSVYMNGKRPLGTVDGALRMSFAFAISVSIVG